MILSESLKAHTMQYLRECLDATQGNVSRAAQIAGITRTGFHHMCKRHGIPIQVIRVQSHKPITRENSALQSWRA